MKRLLWITIALACALLVITAQDFKGTISEKDRPTIAVPDFRGAGAAQNFMAAFNQTLWSDLEGAGVLKLVSKSMYPLNVPQQPSDFTQPPPPIVETPRRNQKQQPPPPQTGGGRWMSDWSGPPVNARYLAFGY